MLEETHDVLYHDINTTSKFQHLRGKVVLSNFMSFKSMMDKLTDKLNIFGSPSGVRLID